MRNNSKVKLQTLQIALSILLLFVNNCTCRLAPKVGEPANIPSSNDQEEPPSNDQEKLPVNQGLGGGIPNIGNSCYMNSTLQIFKAVYPHVFEGKSDPISQAGQKLMEALDKEACVSSEIAEDFLEALQANSGWPPVKYQQEDPTELLRILFDKFDFPKASTKRNLIHPTTRETRPRTGLDPWDMMVIPIDPSAKTMQDHFNANLREETIDDYKWEDNDLNHTPGIKSNSLLDELGRLQEKTLALVVQLGLFKNDKKDSTKISTIVEDPFNLVIKKDQIYNGTKDISYELVGFLSHYGPSLNSGHYVAYAKKGDQWGRYDDSIVTAVSEQEANTAAKSAYTFLYKQQ